VTVILVTHNLRLAALAHRTIELRDDAYTPLDSPPGGHYNFRHFSGKKRGQWSRTLAQLLVNSVTTYPKPDFMLFRRRQSTRPSRRRNSGGREASRGSGSGRSARCRTESSASCREPAGLDDDRFRDAHGRRADRPRSITTLVRSRSVNIIDDSDASVVVVSNADHWRKVESLRAGLAKVKHYITFADEAPAGVLTLKAVIGQGQGRRGGRAGPVRCARRPGSSRRRGDPHLHVGDDRRPKGVILTHDNLVSNIRTASDLVEFSSKDTVLSFLPLSQSSSAWSCSHYVYKGCSVGFAESVEAVAKNLLEVRPHTHG